MFETKSDIIDGNTEHPVRTPIENIDNKTYFYRDMVLVETTEESTKHLMGSSGVLFLESDGEYYTHWEFHPHEILSRIEIEVIPRRLPKFSFDGRKIKFESLVNDQWAFGIPLKVK